MAIKLSFFRKSFIKYIMISVLLLCASCVKIHYGLCEDEEMSLLYSLLVSKNIFCSIITKIWFSLQFCSPITCIFGLVCRDANNILIIYRAIGFLLTYSVSVLFFKKFIKNKRYLCFYSKLYIYSICS